MSSQIFESYTIHTDTYSTVATTMSLETYTLALSHSRARRWQRLIDEAIWGPSEPTHLGCQSKKETLVIQGDFFNWASPEYDKCWPVSD